MIFSERERAVAEVRAQPDFGPDGPTEDDIDREIRDILKKIRRLKKNPGGEDYEFKLAWRVQINLALLVSILLELLELIRKLRKRPPVTG